MKICTVVGARPQFVKASALSGILRQQHTEILIHTGQHYDDNMSEVFFRELGIPEPDYNLGIYGGTHGRMTGSMLPAIEEILLNERPNVCLVYGDTNSTLAGALAAVKLKIPVAHVEAGIRVGFLHWSPEEVNRILTDRISHLLFCCTQRGMANLAAEGIVEGVHNTGDVMYDAFLSCLRAASKPVLYSLGGSPVNLPKEYYLLTIHRPQNAETEGALREILSAMNGLDRQTVFPVHPRTRLLAETLCNSSSLQNILLVQPVGYQSSLYLSSHARKVVTDSGGIQKEAWFARVPCVTILDHNGWPETLEGHMNQLCRPDRDEILLRLSIAPDVSARSNQFGDGHASAKIAEILTEWAESQAVMGGTIS